MKQYFGVGTYTEPILFGTGEVFQGKGKGLYVCSFEKGKIETISVLPMKNPSFFCYDSEFKKIYAVNEGKEFNGHFGGGITEVDVKGKYVLSEKASYCTGGTDPCHVAVSPNKKFVAVANFASGSMSAFRLSGKGSIVPGCLLFQNEGSSINPVRQKGPHAHSVIFDSSRRILVPDLGADKVFAFKYEEEVIVSDEVKTVESDSGNGPRYGEFSQDYKHFYLINEIASSVTHFTCKSGKLNKEETVCTLPEDFKGNNICSDLHISKDGNFLYASNRGHDSITVFSINKKSGELSFCGRVSCGGKTPRNFCLEPSGSYMLVGNQDSDNITVFKIGKDGIPEAVNTVDFPSPVCIRFF